MITTQGAMQFKRFLGGYTPNIARTIAFGIGDSPEAIEDTRLDFEVGRGAISLLGFNFETNMLIFKTTVDPNYAGTINEVGLYLNQNNVANSRMISTFDNLTETWDSGVWETVNARLGTTSLRIDAAAGSNAGATVGNLVFDLSANSGDDKIVLARTIGDNVSSYTVRFKTNVNSYFQFQESDPLAGYDVVQFPKGEATIVGSPDWASISIIEVRVNAKAAGNASVWFDGLRVEPDISMSTEYVLVARQVLETPFVKELGVVQDIEVAVPVNIT